MNLILASASAARRRLLATAGVPFTVVPAAIDEGRLTKTHLADGVEPHDVAAALALAKALHVASAHPGETVLGADQTLLFAGELIGKCPDLASARALLRRLRGKPHRLVSALVLVRDGVAVWRHIALATLDMRSFSDAFLEVYLAAEGESLLSGVGCYKLEGLGAQLFERIEGDYFSILGLPLLPLLAELRKQGVIAS